MKRELTDNELTILTTALVTYADECRKLASGALFETDTVEDKRMRAAFTNYRERALALNDLIMDDAERIEVTL